MPGAAVGSHDASDKLIVARSISVKPSGIGISIEIGGGGGVMIIVMSSTINAFRPEEENEERSSAG